MVYIAFALLVSVAFVALGRKWDFRLQTVLPWTALMLVAGGAFVLLLKYLWPILPDWVCAILGSGVAFCLTLTRILYLFYRDPRRTPPEGDRILVSPADGRIVYVKEVEDGTFPFAVKKGRSIPISQFTSEDFPADKFIHVGIEMTYIDVHINRAPISGTVARLVRVPGVFKSLRLVEALLENERVYTLIRGEAITIGMLQIASRMVRRIIPFVKEDEAITLGQRIGTIRFGSQVDLLIPSSEALDILVKPDDAVRAGETILARY